MALNAFLNRHVNGIEDTTLALPVFQTHDIVEDGIDSGTEVVEEAGDVEEIFVDSTEQCGIFEVDKCEALGMERGPADEEGYNNRSYRTKKIYVVHYTDIFSGQT